MNNPGQLVIDSLAQRYRERHPHDCAGILLTPGQALAHVVGLTALFGLFLYRWDCFLVLVNCTIALGYLSVIVFRAWAAFLSLASDPTIRIEPVRLDEMDAAELPVYTLLVPLYREANVVGELVHGIGRMDYPPDRLDVKLLLEEDDHETLEALQALGLPPYCEVVVCPDALPKTKPRACDHGLARARGRYCVVYDAEDRPEADQLRKAVLAFREQPDDVVCLQARLAYYNADANILTRWFAVEYATTFELLLPGLDAMGLVVPLGGTSNHFRTDVLRELGGWDPFNVTEDCDLGVRIYRAGYRTRMLGSTTWEEATSQLGNWLRQRSRWVKGFLQTHLVHSRHPLRMVRHLGPFRSLGFFLCVGGSALMMVLNVVYWGIGLAYLALLAHGMAHGLSLFQLISEGTRSVVRPTAFALREFSVRAWPLLYYGEQQDAFWSTLSIVFFAVSCVLLAANLLFVGFHAAACLKTGRRRLLPYALTMPLYWVLISLGAWKGFLQLLHRPFYWEKTPHGVGGGNVERQT